MGALVQHLRATEFGGRVAEPPAKDPVERAAQWEAQLQAAEQQAGSGLGNSTGAHAYIVPKLLFWEVTTWQVRAPDSLTALRNLLAHAHLDTIPSYLSKGTVLQARYNCPLILLPGYIDQARAALQQRPEALEVALANPDLVSAALWQYRNTHGYAPNLAQLFAAVHAAANSKGHARRIRQRRQPY